MRPGSRYRIARWAGGVTAVLAGVVIVVATAGFVPAYVDDPSLGGKADYLGVIMGSVSLLVVLIQFLRGLGRWERPQDLATRLQSEIREDLVRRLGHMRRTSEDIVLLYWSAARRAEVAVAALADSLLRDRARVVVVGRAGRGKSYSALQIALEVIRREPTLVPLVVPLSRWTGDQDVVIWLSRFIAAEFNVSPGSARELIASGKVLALFDGMDELCAQESDVEPAERFLERLVEWRLQGDRAPFLLTCRRSSWDAIRQELREHHTLDPYSILPVQYEDAKTYLSRSLGGTDGFRPAAELAASLRTSGRESLLTSPWRLSLVAELAKHRDLATVAESADPASLVAKYVASVGAVDAGAFGRLRNVVELWWLSNYARYLERNRTEQTVIAGRLLSARDIVLHRLWPAAGARSPLVVDCVMCVLLSIPGILWGFSFLWGRGWVARVALVASVMIWSALLVRTSTKPWVRAATPDWSRLTDPRFFLRQMGAALAVGAAAWVVVGPWAGIISFATAWLAIGLTVGFGQTLATDTRPEVVGPVGVLRRERTVSRLSALVVLPALAWGFSLTWGPWWGTGLAVVYCLVVGETVACALWRRYLAMIVASRLRLPLTPAGSLQRMCSLGFLRVAGISYQFRHDDILRHFAYSYDVRVHLRQARRGGKPPSRRRRVIE
ncbi:NACHT domain-containing protein [Phytohabitans sp. ZYX-F-186]|uniref:NACHT domain-containing protein n=1 Tax=Phytohabitans maris TaxID=3071409 RepID=A0ABU0ZQB7_9ACTN|nr:NACHT domain-containing protein [Phytohabitans sp. ZYX-F-186]MDQ7908544.1 NACHT domain-containing protein [Phytohabitans sp. ZYX-F-186]